MNEGQMPQVSFVVPTLNAINHLPRLVRSIHSQSYPQDRIEIIIADGGSTDGTLEYCKGVHLKIIHNSDVLHELGKSKAATDAQGEIVFYTDADNELSSADWIRQMIFPYLENKQIIGFLPQTIPAPDSHPINRYLGYLFTDPFTWFVYGNLANPIDYKKEYIPIYSSTKYQLYRFDSLNPPLFGLSQGVGTSNKFIRSELATSDDLYAGLELIKSGGLIAYIPGAGIYHYHVENFLHFLEKYSSRVRANFIPKFQLTGFFYRRKLLSKNQNIRAFIFEIYALSIILPIIDGIKLTHKYRDPVMLWHIPITILEAIIILKELFRYKLKQNSMK